MRSRKIYNSFIAIFFMFITFQISNADACLVDVSQSYYHLWGDIRHYSLFGGADYKDSYNTSATFPIEKAISYTYDWGVYPGAEDTLNAKSKGYEFGLSVYAEAHGFWTTNHGAFAEAEAEWTFKSINDSELLTIKTNMESVPEPFVILLFGSGLIGLAGFRKKLKKK